MGTKRRGISLQVFYSIHSQLTNEYREQVRCWVEHKKRNSIHLYLQATMYYFVPYISTRGFHWLEKLALFTNEKNRINNSCKKLEGAVDKPYQTHMQNYCIFFTCCYGFSQGWKSLYNTTVCIISEGGKEWGGPDPISCLNFEKIFLCDKYHKLRFTCHRFRRENFKLFILCAML